MFVLVAKLSVCDSNAESLGNSLVLPKKESGEEKEMDSISSSLGRGR